MTRIFKCRVRSFWTSLELKLGKNLLAIASHHLGQPAQAGIYFNQSLREDPDRNKQNDLTPPPVA